MSKNRKILGILKYIWRQLEKRIWCAKHNIVHKVITEEDLFANPYRMQNLKILQSHLLRAGAEYGVEKELLLKELRKGVMAVERIFRLIEDKNSAMCLLAKLLYNGEIDIELNKRPIDKHTKVSICKKRNTIL